MLKLIEDWESDKSKEEEEVFERLEEAEKMLRICAVVLTSTDYSQVQLTPCPSSRKMTTPCRKTAAELKLMTKTTAPPRIHQTWTDCPTAKTRVKDIAEWYNTGQPDHLPSANLPGQQNRKFYH